MTGLGIALLLAGVILAVAEAHVAAGGILGAIGVAAAVAGTVLAVDGAGGGIALSVVLAAVVAAVGAGLLVGVARTVGRTLPRRVRSGREALIGTRGVARAPIGPAPGRVLAEGSLWNARTCEPEHPIEAGDPVVVVDVDGLTLIVRRAEPWELTP
ncbi:MAG: serine protease [Solirubrobacteraceae bacterium]|mgnify:CR=1 FL=1|nr:serine protease [Solirubrobacteraceae bacterium]